LFNTHAVRTDLARKQAAIKYLKVVAMENLWKSSPAYLDAARSFDDFKAEILTLYPSLSGDCTYSIQDLNILIGECTWVGIFSTNDAMDYYHQFLLIMRFLINKNRLSTIDLLCNFMRRLCPDLAYCITQQLLLRHLDHPPEDPYEMDNVYNATTFIIGGLLQGVYGAAPPMQVYALGPYQPPTYWAPPTQPAYLAASQQAYPDPSPQAYPAAAQPQNPYAPPAQQVPADPTNVKIEVLTAMVNKFSEMLKTAIETQQGSSKPRNVGPRPTGVTGLLCNFCGGTGHFIKECRVVMEYC
jgi:hypothetical protein